MESSNSWLRRECLNEYGFLSIADFFGDSTARHQIKAGFEALLKHVRNGENIARQAQQAEILEKRWTASEPSDFCVAHWYEESVSRSNA